MRRYQKFAPRSVAFDGLVHCNGFELRSYSVNKECVQASAVSPFQEGVRLALENLPSVRDESCPGAGFIIKHQGVDANYVVLAWWTQENELPTRVFVTDRKTGKWREAKNESFCVWDLEIMWQERNHYIRTVLGGSSNVSDYLDKPPELYC